MTRKGNSTERIRAFLKPLLSGLLIVAWFAVWGWQKWQYRTTIETLTSISPEQVTIFRIYPRVGIPVDTVIDFMPPDPIITDFFQALADHRPYSYSHDTGWEEHTWFFEVAAGEVFIQISFHIPDDHDSTVAGMLGKFTKDSTTSYGYFQSKQLYQWYQKHSHRWLVQKEL